MREEGKGRERRRQRETAAVEWAPWTRLDGRGEQSERAVKDAAVTGEDGGE